MSPHSDALGGHGFAGRFLAAIDDRSVTTALRIDGQVAHAALALDPVESDRRRCVGVKAIVDSGLLHALWSLPEGAPIPVETMSQRDLETVRDLGGGAVEIKDGYVVRTYSPIGTVRALAVSASSARVAVRGVGSYSPIFRRVALVTGAEVDEPDVELAIEYGIGLSRRVGDEWETLVEPAGPELGVPAVYRWWIAEIAYRNYLAS
jgi:hypothetical protein